MSSPAVLTGALRVKNKNCQKTIKCELWEIDICKFKTLLQPETKIAEFANSVDLDEVAHNEPPHLDLHCLPSSL